ncbi:MAG TPA: pyridoxamine 5'-phosphate oxidase family protein [Acidimicrobiales bacterium]|jgi:general stress protein 26
MRESPDEIDRLQALLDASAASAGRHLRDVITEDRRISAQQVCDELSGMRLIVLGTSTADGRPLVGPVDGYFLHGDFWFSSGKDSVRMRHIAARPHVSATYLAGPELAITVHGRAAIFELNDPQHSELRQAMLDHYLPIAGEEFREWIDSGDSYGARITTEKIFTFWMPET